MCHVPQGLDRGRMPIETFNVLKYEARRTNKANDVENMMQNVPRISIMQLLAGSRMRLTGEASKEEVAANQPMQPHGGAHIVREDGIRGKPVSVVVHKNINTVFININRQMGH